MSLQVIVHPPQERKGLSLHARWGLTKEVTVQQEFLLTLYLQTWMPGYYQVDNHLHKEAYRKEYPFFFTTGTFITRCKNGMFNRKANKRTYGHKSYGGTRRYNYEQVMEYLRKKIEKQSVCLDTE